MGMQQAREPLPLPIPALPPSSLYLLAGNPKCTGPRHGPQKALLYEGKCSVCTSQSSCPGLTQGEQKRSGSRWPLDASGTSVQARPQPLLRLSPIHSPVQSKQRQPMGDTARRVPRRAASSPCCPLSHLRCLYNKGRRCCNGH